MSGEAICDFLAWDSEFFGKRIARYNGRRMDARQARALDAFCEDDSIDCIYLLVDSTDPETIREAERRGFSLMDIRVTFTHDFSRQSTNRAKADPRVRSSASDDHERLRNIASSVFDYTRFYIDEKFRSRAPELYELWVERSLTGDGEVFVSDASNANGGISGFITCDIEREESYGSIGLVGVDAAHRGQGIGRILVEAVLDYCAEESLRTVRVVTQGRNLHAQALYQRTGFVTSSVQLWYHKWYR